MQTPSKILVLSTWDNQGSGNASYKITRFLLDAGHEVAMMVRDRYRSDSFIIPVRSRPLTITKRIYKRLARRTQAPIRTLPEYDFLNINESKQYASADDLIASLPFIPDLVITGLISGFVNTQTLADFKLKTGALIYLLTVDMAGFTGGCHYAWDCTGYQFACSDCPAIIDKKHKQRAHKNLLLKIHNITRGDIRVLAGSGETLIQLQQSTLFKNQKAFYNINSCIDVNIFNPSNRNIAKQVFAIKEDIKVIFTGSSYTPGKRKGISYFVEALDYLWNSLSEEERKNTLILIAGRGSEKNPFIEKIKFNKHIIEFIEDQRLLVLAYQASDIFVCPSIEDAGPMMVSEALACGTPVVGFDIGILCNMVVNGITGFKGPVKDSQKMAEGMQHLLRLTADEFQNYSQNAVALVREQSSQYTVVNVVNEILTQEKTQNK